MYVLENGSVHLAVNELGMLTELSMPGQGNVIARPTGLFRAILQTNDNWEDLALPEEQRVTVEKADDSIVIRTTELVTRMGAKQIALKLTIRLNGDNILFNSEIANNSDSVVNEWIYPCLGVIDTLEGGKPALYYPKHMGEKILNICEYLRGMNGREQYHELTQSYPGPLSMQWMLLEDGATCLYLSGRDELCHTSALRVKGSAAGGVTMEMNKMVFVRAGETRECPAYIARLYKGSWLESAREYSAWAKSWRTPAEPEEWFKHMNGYFLVINKEQYGDENWPYETIPQLYDYAQAHGFDTLGLFGWYHSGHDNQYPDLEVSPTMGGEDKLKEGISAVHEKGGHVTLYYQGHLMDPTAPYYRERGHLLEGKNRWGTPYYEFYPKFCASDLHRAFSKKVFATVCPSCTEWHELMAERADWVRSFGADGILYDQIGGMPPYPCFDETHAHPLNRPSLSHPQGRIKLHQRIHEQVRKHPHYGYMTEHVTDVHSQYPDCLHGIGSFPGARGSGSMSNGVGVHDTINSGRSDVGPTAMPEMYRYTFPETLITIRNANPFVSVRYANYAFLYGYKLEMEIRYRTDREFLQADEAPAERAYVKKVAELRRAHEECLLLGRFEATEGLANQNPAVKAAVYERADGRKAVALWNDTDSEQPIHISLHGQALNAWADPEKHGSGIPKTIAPEGILLLYEE